MTSHPVSICTHALVWQTTTLAKNTKKGGGTNNQTFHTSNKIKQTGFHIEYHPSPSYRLRLRIRTISQAVSLCCFQVRRARKMDNITYSQVFEKNNTHTHRHSTHSPFFPHRLYGSIYRSILSKPLEWFQKLANELFKTIN